MSRGLKWFTTIILAIVVAIGVLLFMVRSNDGPMEIISGGPFQSGEPTTGTSDWRFLDEHMTVELQTMIPPRSRTMWLVVVDNRPFVLSNFMNSRVGKLWKKWPRTLEKDNRAIVRAQGKLYELKLVRTTEGEIIGQAMEHFNAKYRTNYTADNVTSGNVWLFELTAR